MCVEGVGAQLSLGVRGHNVHSALFGLVGQTMQTKGHSLIATYSGILGPLV